MSSSARVSASVGTGRKGGKEPDLKRRRLLDAGGPIEDDETARQKMRDAWVYNNDDEVVGFDPDDVKKHGDYLCVMIITRVMMMKYRPCDISLAVVTSL